MNDFGNLLTFSHVLLKNNMSDIDENNENKQICS